MLLLVRCKPTRLPTNILYTPVDSILLDSFSSADAPGGASVAVDAVSAWRLSSAKSAWRLIGEILQDTSGCQLAAPVS